MEIYLKTWIASENMHSFPACSLKSEFTSHRRAALPLTILTPGYVYWQCSQWPTCQLKWPSGKCRVRTLSLIQNRRYVDEVKAFKAILSHIQFLSAIFISKFTSEWHDILIKLTFEMLTAHLQQHSFSTQNVCSWESVKVFETENVSI